jgi:gliding motility-associated-like protein
VNWDFGDGNHWEQFDGTKHSFDQAGTYRITATGNYPVCASVSASDSVVVSAFPVVNLGPDSVICLDGPSITLSDLNNGSNPAVKWLWNTGDTSSSIVVVHPGTYSVTASENNCATTDNVIVNKDCYTDIPNAFTPNGDGSNDYFFPRQLLSKGVAGFTMSVYNRWGQKLFETDNPNGRGWDGKFNEKEQPMGVYIYQMKVVLKNGRIEEYEGNVTLVR